MSDQSEHKFKPRDFGEEFTPEELARLRRIPDTEVTNKTLDVLAVKAESWGSCAKCGAVCENVMPFCGACGNKNELFNTEAFEQEFGKSLEQIKKEYGCSTGHMPAREESAEPLVGICIYCGKAY